MQSYGERNMRNIVEMTKYRLHIWGRGHLYIMPTVVLALYDGFCYSIRPAQLETCMVMLCFVLFFTMVWMGYMIADRENSVEEQLLYLRVVRKSSYYLGKSLFLLVVQLIFATLAIAIPMAFFLTGTELFTEPVTVGNLAQSFLLFFGSAGAGVALGSLLFPQVMKDRRLSPLLTIFLTLTSALKTALKKYAVTGWLVRLLPPIAAIGESYGDGSSFQAGRTVALLGTLLLYSIAYLALRDVISYKRGFR